MRAASDHLCLIGKNKEINSASSTYIANTRILRKIVPSPSPDGGAAEPSALPDESALLPRLALCGVLVWSLLWSAYTDQTRPADKYCLFQSFKVIYIYMYFFFQVLHNNMNSVVILCLQASMTEKELNGHPKAQTRCLQAIREDWNAGVCGETSGDCGHFLQALIFMNICLQSASVCTWNQSVFLRNAWLTSWLIADANSQTSDVL